MGNTNKIYSLVRAMLISAAFGHSPDQLRIAVVTTQERARDWEWIKWLPHAQNPARETPSGLGTQLYTSFEDYIDDQNLILTAPPLQDQENTHTLTVVDMPGHDTYSPRLNKNYTYIVAASDTDTIATNPSNNYTVDNDGIIILPKSSIEVSCDQLSLKGAENIARKFAPYTTMALSMAAGDIALPTNDPVGTVHKKLTWFDALDIGDIDTFNPTPRWQDNMYTGNFVVPLGYRWQSDHYDEGDVVTLDLGEPGAGGNGPHGNGGGQSGMGKSIFLQILVSGLMARYSPRCVAFILMDFKGGSTFQGFDRMPHTVASISNLEGEVDMVDRAFSVIQGLIAKRMEMFDQLQVKDILDYRKKKKKGKLPPEYDDEPDYFIVADEYTEFIHAHPEFKELFASVGRVGRSLGIHMLPFTQKMDTMLLGDLAEQLAFGISLKVPDTASSRAVVHSDIAVQLESSGEAILYLDSNHQTTRFKSFYGEAPYIPKKQKEETESVEVETREAMDVSNVQPFHAIESGEGEVSLFAQHEQEIEEDEASLDLEDVDTDELPSMLRVLVDRVSKFDDVKAPQLWTPPLKIPFTYHDLGIGAAQDTKYLQAPVGYLDDPYNHRRFPYMLRLAGPSSSVMVVGGPSSGKTSALQSIVSSLCLAYSPKDVQFILMDYTGKGDLGRVDSYPHVIGSGRGTNEDQVVRFFGELERIQSIRTKRMGEWDSQGFNDYLKQRGERNAKGDPYGRIVVVADGLSILDADEKETMPEHPYLPRYTNWLRNGESVGIHVVGSLETVPAKWSSGVSFNALALPGASTDELKMHNVWRSKGSDVARELAEKTTRQPISQPGRFVVPDGLYGRFRFPIEVPYEPASFDKNGEPVYEATDKYNGNVQELGDKVDAAVPRGEKPHKLKLPDRDIDFGSFIQSYMPFAVKDSKNIRVPVGQAVKDLSFVEVPQGRNVAVFGKTKSGRTTVLRTLVSSIVAQTEGWDADRRPRFVIMDSSGGAWWAEKDVLREKGMLLKNGYVSTAGEASRIVDVLSREMKRRVPKQEQLDELTLAELRERTWYDRPDIYVIVDGMRRFEGDFANPILSKMKDTLNEVGRGDLGVTFYFADSDTEGTSMTTNSNNLYSALNSVSGVDVCVLSSEPKNRIANVATRNFVAGRGSWKSADGGVRVVQVAHAQPYGE